MGWAKLGYHLYFLATYLLSGYDVDRLLELLLDLFS